MLIKVIHAYIADHVVYQSQFVQEWWERSGWRIRTRFSVIGNAVDLQEFRPHGLCRNQQRERNSINLICVEGHIDYSPYAVDLLNVIVEKLAPERISLILYGDFASDSNRSGLSDRIDYRGPIARNEISKVYANGIFLSLDVNAACPNTVIEAMASGIPVIGYRTGAIPELVSDGCGEVVDFGGDPWRLDPPDSSALVTAIVKVSMNYSSYSEKARRHAESKFDIHTMVSRYLKVFDTVLEK